MDDKNLQRIQYRVLERVQEELRFALQHEPADYGDDNPKYYIECDVWETINQLYTDIDDLLIDYKKHERRFVVGEYYLDEMNGKYVKCNQRTNTSVWLNGYRYKIKGNAKSERTDYVKA